MHDLLIGVCTSCQYAPAILHSYAIGCWHCRLVDGCTLLKYRYAPRYAPRMRVTKMRANRLDRCTYVPGSNDRVHNLTFTILTPSAPPASGSPAPSTRPCLCDPSSPSAAPASTPASASRWCIAAFISTFIQTLQSCCCGLICLCTAYYCAFKPGRLMSHNWLHTPDCRSP